MSYCEAWVNQMRKSDFIRTVRETPVMVPVFRLIRDYNGPYPMRKGTEAYVDRDGNVVHIRTGIKHGSEVGPGYLQFVEYRNLNKK